VTQTNVPAQPVEEVPPPEVKAEPVKPKPKPQAKKPDAEAAAAEAILLPVSPSVAPPLTETKTNPAISNTQGAAGANAAQAEPPPVKTEVAAPPVKTEENPPQGGTTAAGSVTDPGAQAATPVNEGDLVDLSAVTEQPKLLKSAEPVYPPTAQRLGIGGSITVNALIDEKGNVIDTGILKGMQDDKGLGKAAENAVKKFKFEPARKNGVAVKVRKSFVIAFKAVKNPASVIE
jgi:TonB family protein